MKIYRGAVEDDRPVEMECRKARSLNEALCGDVFQEDVHFQTEAEAWDSILAAKLNSVNALRIDIGKKEQELLKLRFQLDDATAQYYAARFERDGKKTKV